MAKYEILISKSAVKELEQIPKKNMQRIVKKIQSLAANPRPKGSQKLSHLEQYRIRQGNNRIVYLIQDSEITVQIVKIGHRKEIYRT